ncbi:hypothetical protein BCR39DRAFT_516718 [Naematelia encephala]|uniref:TPR-like protein n=1 Tax=Naematelia encephala TaxID=71784 RepID=A0A1Y2BHC9_9TREE|nr:hypothetical protein BCR39DRAFT_516718 [Naematelia encephala]
MSNPKAVHYHAALTSALLRGAWAEPTPGTAPNGTLLSWGELVRKWGKHTGGNTALIHHLREISLLYLSSTLHPTSSSGFINVPQTGLRSDTNATSVPPVAEEPSSGSSAEIASNTTSGSSFIHVPHPHLRRHKSKLSTDGAAPSSSGSTIRAIGASDEGSRAAYLSPGDLDGDEEDAGSWAEGTGWWSGVNPDHVYEVKEGIRDLEALLSGGKLKKGEIISARLILAYHLHAIGSHEGALRIYDEALHADEVQLGAVEGDAAILEHVRAQTLRGISSELLAQSDPDTAMQCYLSASHFAKTLSTSPFPLPAYLQSTNSQSQKLPFDSHRELHRHLSTSLSRAAVISARRPNSIIQSLRTLRTYHAHSLSWPSSFRPRQRQRMLLLYLRALLVGLPRAGVAAESPYLLEEGITSLSGRQIWQKEASAAITQGRSLLSATTQFPRAGSINAPVTAFTEFCVSLADAHPSLAREVIQVLWWSMTLTFQSQSVLRQLTRLLVAVGDKADARRTFELYIQLVLKSRETQQPDISLQLKRRPTDDIAVSPKEIQQQAEQAEAEDNGDRLGEERKGQMPEAEIDNDDNLIGALLIGARLLLKDLGDTDDAWRYAVLVADVVENGARRGRTVRQSLQAEVEEAKGIIRMAMAGRAGDPIARPTYQAQSLTHLKSAVSLDPSSPTAFYHLAYCQAEARAIDDAITSIHAALELDSKNVQSWHLLALLLTAQGDWTGAAKAGEAGVSVWEAEEDELWDEMLPSEEAGVETRDFAVASLQQAPTQRRSEPLLSLDGSLKSLPSVPPHTYPTPPEITRARRLEHVIRLRMTLNVIVEKTQGPEMAMLRQQELFAFFSARSGKNRGAALGRGLQGSTSSTSVGDARDLGGSYISVETPAANSGTLPSSGANDRVSVIPPTPNVDSIPSAPLLAAPIGLAAPSNDNSPESTIPSSPEPRDDDKASVRFRSGGRAKKALTKHLHVPSTLGRGSRPSSVRRLATPTASETSELKRLLPRLALADVFADSLFGPSRRASISSTTPSIAPTAAHSHFHTSSRTPAPPPPPPMSSANDHGRTPAESRILSNLWLMSAATFRRWGKPDQSLVAIEESETLDPLNPDVWIQLGLHHLSHSPPAYESALAAFTKSILLRPNHASAIVHLAKLYLSTGQVELAHQLLNQSTQDEGWDCPEAWYVLGKVCQVQERHERARECWMFALGLEKTRPGGVGGWDVIERWL